MRILVTGSNGHVGGAITRRLHDSGHTVLAVSRSISPSIPKEIEQRSLDIAHGGFLEEVLSWAGSCDAFVHAAACLGDDSQAMEISRTNCTGVQQSLLTAKSLGAHSFIFISSLSVLGSPREHPITEDHPLGPRDLYGASKLCGEWMTLQAGKSGLAASALRISSPIGPGLRHRRIFRIFVEKALRGEPIPLNGAGKRRQDYVDVRDIALAVEQILSKGCCGIFNIGSGRPISNYELAERCIQSLESTSEIEFTGLPDPSDSVTWDISIDRAYKAFGYSPAHDLEKSITALAHELNRF